MLIDIIFFILLIIAIIKGISKGFVVAVFSFFAIIIGVAAAMKLSSIVAGKLQHAININQHWLPFISFLIVLIIVIFLVRWMALIIQKALNMAMLGWANKLGGIVLFALLYLSIYSIILFYLTKMDIIKQETIAASFTYHFIEPFGPKVVDIIGAVIPVFKNLFQQLTDYFSSLAQQHASAVIMY